jgi:hypothetical protein
MAADGPRKNDLDGRCSLSQAALTEFCEFFLRISIDQVEFMESLLQPGELLRESSWTSKMKCELDVYSKEAMPYCERHCWRETWIAQRPAHLPGIRNEWDEPSSRSYW